MTAILHEFAVSHFCEKARWALELLDVPHTRQIWLPGIHARAIQRIAPRTTVPVLVDGDTVVQGSGAIIDHAQIGRANLLDPSDLEAARADEAWMDRDLGETVRCLAYTDLINDRRGLIGLWSQGGPWWSKAFLTVGFGQVRKVLRKMYVDKPRLQDSRPRLEAALEALDARYAEAPYLADGRFTRLDLTAAALLSPLVRPPQHPLRWQAPLPPILAGIHARFAEGPALQRVRAIYAEHR